MLYSLSSPLIKRGLAVVMIAMTWPVTVKAQDPFAAVPQDLLTRFETCVKTIRPHRLDECHFYQDCFDALGGTASRALARCAHEEARVWRGVSERLERLYVEQRPDLAEALETIREDFDGLVEQQCTLQGSYRREGTIRYSDAALCRLDLIRTRALILGRQHRSW